MVFLFGCLMFCLLLGEFIGFFLILRRFLFNFGFFNVKEYVLIIIFVNIGFGVMGVMLVNVVKVFYK